MQTQPRRITIAHSPDSDDAFMFYALAKGLIDTEGLEVVEELQDIESLNQRCLRAELELSAASVHAYAYFSERYAVLPCGASLGEGYGPRVVSREPLEIESLSGRPVAIPGMLTSAALALRLFLPSFELKLVPFDRILEAVRDGEVDAGLVIHEGQLTYRRFGLHLVADLGELWLRRTGLPLPLGVNVVRRDLGEETIRQVGRLLQRSIEYGLEHRSEALDHAMSHARGLERRQVDRFVGLYVNDLTRDLGERGREAVRRLLEQGHEAGIIPRPVAVEFVRLDGSLDGSEVRRG